MPEPTPEHPLGTCSACPVRAAGLTDLPCPCRKNPRLAELYNADPARQGPKLVALAPILASWPDAGERAPRPVAAVPTPPGPPIDQEAARDALYRACGRSPRLTLPDGCGVLMAADAKAFAGLQLALASVLLGHDLPACVFDLGLLPAQRAWLSRQPRVEVRPPSLPEGIRFEESRNRWTLWCKPFLFSQSPFRRTLWLDSDTLCRADLRGPFAAIGRGPLAMPESFSTDPAFLRNRPGLYERYPVPGPELPSLNSGVVGWDAGRPLDREWVRLAAWLVAEAIRDESVRGLVVCWDQGALKWAAEKVGVGTTGNRSWNRPGWAVAEIGRAMDAAEVVGRVPDGSIGHFQAEGKPWSRWPGDVPLEIDLSDPSDRLRVFVLGHDRPGLARTPPRPFLGPVNLTALDPDQSAAESRFYAHLPPPESLPEYVGFATWRWDEKWCRWGTLPLAELHRLAPRLRPDRVLCGLLTGRRDIPPGHADYRDVLEQVHPGIGRYVDEMRRATGRREIRASLWSQNFVAHRDVLGRFLPWHAEWMAHFRARYGERCERMDFPHPAPRSPAAWAGEFLCCHWFASEPGIEVVEARADPRPGTPRGPDPAALARRDEIAETHRLHKLARACPDRQDAGGCGCNKAFCARFQKTVYLSDCRACIEKQPLLTT